MMVLAERLISKACHQSSLVGFDLPFVGKIGHFEVHLLIVKLSWCVTSLLVSFVFIMDKSFVRRR